MKSRWLIMLLGFWTLLAPNVLADEAKFDLGQLPVLRVSKTHNATPAKGDEVTVIQAWASWCMSCSSIIPLVQDRLQKSLPTARFVTVSIDEDAVDAQGYLRKHADLFNSRDLFAYRDPDMTLTKKFQLKAVPATIVMRPGHDPVVLNGFDETQLLQALSLSH